MIRERKTYQLAIFIFLSFILHSCASLLTPGFKNELISLKQGQYELDPRHTAVLFKVKHMGFSKFVGRFEVVDASLDFDPENMQNSSLEAVVNMASINVNSESFADTLRGRDWLNVEQYPQAVFRSNSVNYVSGNEAEFKGELNFLGVSKPVLIKIHFNGGANNLLSGRYTIGFEAHSSFNRSDFGLKKYIPTVGDKVEVEVHAEFQRIR